MNVQSSMHSNCGKKYITRRETQSNELIEISLIEVQSQMAVLAFIQVPRILAFLPPPLQTVQQTAAYSERDCLGYFHLPFTPANKAGSSRLFKRDLQ